MKKISLYVVGIVIAAFCIFSYYNSFHGTDNNLQDSILQKSAGIDSRIVILGVDDLSLEKYGQWPWSRTYIADAINKLSQGNAAAIGIDLIYSEEARNSEEDVALVNSVKSAENVVMASYGDFGTDAIKVGKMEPIALKEPFPKLKAVSISGEINTAPDNNIVRKALTSFDYKGRKINSFSIEVYNQYLNKTSKNKPNLNMHKDGWNKTYITFTSLPNHTHSFENHPIYKLLDGEIPPEYFKDKIVLIGPYSVGLSDDYYTSINHNDKMYGVEIHANIIQNLLESNFKQYVPNYLNLLLLILFGGLAYFICKKLKPLFSAITLGIFIIAYITIGKIAFKKGYILQFFYQIVLVLIIYIIVLVSQYITEFLEKKRVRDLFGKYVAPQVVSKILDGGEESIKLGGERRFISVLFVDIRGFTPLSEKCEPEEVVDILNQYLDLTSRSIFNNLGMLDKFIGDATMAVFNAPLDLEDHAFRSLQAAWEMKQGADALHKDILEKFGQSVQFGIGVNTGYAVVGNIGSKTRMDYTAIGDTVNISARLESNAKPGQILLSESTYELVKDKVSVIELGEINVKGKEQIITVYELTGIK